jgi:hypothetical protein
MKNFNFKFVTREILGNKPTHYIFTETLGVSVSGFIKNNHQKEVRMV